MSINLPQRLPFPNEIINQNQSSPLPRIVHRPSFKMHQLPLNNKNSQAGSSGYLRQAVPPSPPPPQIIVNKVPVQRVSSFRRLSAENVEVHENRVNRVEKRQSISSKPKVTIRYSSPQSRSFSNESSERINSSLLHKPDEKIQEGHQQLVFTKEKKNQQPSTQEVKAHKQMALVEEDKKDRQLDSIKEKEGSKESLIAVKKERELNNDIYMVDRRVTESWSESKQKERIEEQKKDWNLGPGKQRIIADVSNSSNSERSISNDSMSRKQKPHRSDASSGRDSAQHEQYLLKDLQNVKSEVLDEYICDKWPQQVYPLPKPQEAYEINHSQHNTIVEEQENSEQSMEEVSKQMQLKQKDLEIKRLKNQMWLMKLQYQQMEMALKQMKNQNVF